MVASHVTSMWKPNSALVAIIIDIFVISIRDSNREVEKCRNGRRVKKNEKRSYPMVSERCSIPTYVDVYHVCKHSKKCRKRNNTRRYNHDLQSLSVRWNERKKEKDATKRYGVCNAASIYRYLFRIHPIYHYALCLIIDVFCSETIQTGLLCEVGGLKYSGWRGGTDDR